MAARPTLTRRWWPRSPAAGPAPYGGRGTRPRPTPPTSTSRSRNWRPRSECLHAWPASRLSACGERLLLAGEPVGDKLSAAAHMLFHRLLGYLGGAKLQRAEDDFVLAQVLLQRPGGPGILMRAAGERLGEAVPERLPLLAQPVGLPGHAAGRGQPGREPFQLSANQVAVPDVPGLRALDPKPTAGPGLDHPDDLQAAQRLPDRLPAHPEPLGQMLLAQPATQRVLAHHDRVRDLAGEPFRHRGLLALTAAAHRGPADGVADSGPRRSAACQARSAACHAAAAAPRRAARAAASRCSKLTILARAASAWRLRLAGRPATHTAATDSRPARSTTCAIGSAARVAPGRFSATASAAAPCRNVPRSERPSARAPPTVAIASTSAAPSAEPAAAAARSAARISANMSGSPAAPLESRPSATPTPAPSRRRTGQVPTPSRVLDPGQCTTVQRARASRPTWVSSSHTPCANELLAESNPARSRRPTGSGASRCLAPSSRCACTRRGPGTAAMARSALSLHHCGATGPTASTLADPYRPSSEAARPGKPAALTPRLGTNMSCLSAC